MEICFLLAQKFYPRTAIQRYSKAGGGRTPLRPDPSFWMEVSGQPHEMAALPSEEKSSGTH